MDPAAARPAPAWRARRCPCACLRSRGPSAPLRWEEAMPSWGALPVTSYTFVTDLYRDERRHNCELLLPATENSWSDAIAARHLGGARSWSRYLFEDPLLVCFTKAAPMPLTRPRNNRAFRARGRISHRP